MAAQHPTTASMARFLPPRTAMHALLAVAASASVSCVEPSYGAGAADAQADAQAVVVDASREGDARQQEGQPRDAAEQPESATATPPVDPSPLAPSDAGADADAQVVPPLSDAQAEQLIGSYIARSYGFWVDNSGLKMMVEELGLADFVRVGDHVELTMRVCRQLTRSGGFVVDLASPADFPEQRRTVSFGDDGWSTDDKPISTGFDREGVAACAQQAGQSVPKQPAQRWLTSTCRCPLTSAEPPKADDCRVDDDDDDHAPALSYRMQTLGWTVHLATVIRSHHVRGKQTAPGKQTAQVELDEVAYQLSCEGLNCVDTSRSGRPCTSEHNGTEFVALATNTTPASFTCATAVTRESEFFPRPFPTQPATCNRGVLTDDPSRP